MKNKLRMLHGEMHVDISKYTGNKQFLTEKLCPKSLTEIIHVGESLENQGLSIIYKPEHTDWQDYLLISGSYHAFNVPQAKKYISKVQNNLKKSGHEVHFVKGNKNLVDKVLVGKPSETSEVEIFTKHDDVYISFESRKAMKLEKMREVNTIVQQAYNLLQEYM